MSITAVVVLSAIFLSIMTLVIADERSSSTKSTATAAMIALDNLATIPPDCSWEALRCYGEY